MNKAILMGRLGKDPELSYTQGGTARCRFSLATSEKYTTNSGEKREDTQWHNIVAWGKQAELAGKYLAKGRLVLIEGKIENRSWDDQQSGQKKYISEIKVDRITFLPSGDRQGGGGGGGGGTGGSGGGSGSGSGSGGQDGPDEDDIPF